MLKEKAKLLNEVKEYLSVNKIYKIPNAIPHTGALKYAYDKRLTDITQEILFEFIGMTGNDTKLQFKAIPGGWTITLAPEQLMSVVFKEGA